MFDHVSTSELHAFMRCRREHTNVFTLGYEPIAEAQPFVFGKLVHKGLEAWWRAAKPHRLSAALLRIERTLDEKPELVDAFDRAKVEELLRGYDARWGEETLAMIAVEQEFRAPLIHPITREISPRVGLWGRIDTIAGDPNGNVWIVEHKTAQDASPGPYWERLRIDLQCSIYLLGARALGLEPAGVLYDVIEKPRLYPFRATERRPRDREESPDEFRVRLAGHLASHSPYKRGIVVRLEMDEVEAGLDLWDAAHEIAALRERVRCGERSPRNPDACFRYGRMCEFFGPCTNSADLSDERLFRRTKRALAETEKTQ